ncbi:hypothetical protein MCETE7_01142 [Acidimicrobiia bacterium]
MIFRPLRKIAICAVALAIVAMSVTVFPQERKADAAIENFPTPWTVSVTPTSSLLDGQIINITIKTDVDHPVDTVSVQVCRPGVQYLPNGGNDPNEDFRLGGANCPPTPLSTSGDLRIAEQPPTEFVTTDAGYTFPMFVGTGTAVWSDFQETEQTLTCDEFNPCALVVQVRGEDEAGDYRWIPFVTELTYQTYDPVASCGGKSTDSLSAASSDRMIDLWIRWTLEQCKLPGAQTGAAVIQTFVAEESAMDFFSSGDTDIAYSAVGYEKSLGFGTGTESEPIATRDSVAIPVALNAVVLAIGNGTPGPGGQKIPYSNVKMTIDEATLFISGTYSGLEPLRNDFLSRNPQIAGSDFFSRSTVSLGATAEDEATSWFFTNHFDVIRPALWKVPDDNRFGPEQGMERGTYSQLPTANPSFGGVLDLFTGRTALDRAIKRLSKSDYGGVWAVTDAATANALAMAPAQISYDSNGANFVGPTRNAMVAALPTMITTADGRLMPDPTKFVDSSGPDVDGQLAYPMTYVEYAIVPKAPLVDKSCAPRSGSQTVLNNWLNYVVNEGQANLPGGMMPLTDELKATAVAAIAQVGTGANTCTPAATGAPAGSGGGTVVAPSATGVAGRGAARTAVVAATGTGAAGGGTQVLADAELASALADMGSLNNGSASSGLIAIGGLLAVLGLLIVSAMATAGKLNFFGRAGK